MAFFTTGATSEQAQGTGEADHTRRTAYPAILRKPSDRGARSFPLCTTVRHKSWTGQVHFALILPFHHLVVRAMGRHAAPNPPGPPSSS